MGDIGLTVPCRGVWIEYSVPPPLIWRFPNWKLKIFFVKWYNVRSLWQEVVTIPCIWFSKPKRTYFDGTGANSNEKLIQAKLKSWIVSCKLLCSIDSCKTVIGRFLQNSARLILAKRTVGSVIEKCIVRPILSKRSVRSILVKRSDEFIIFKGQKQK